jgi:hypothetical protein
MNTARAQCAEVGVKHHVLFSGDLGASGTRELFIFYPGGERTGRLDDGKNAETVAAVHARLTTRIFDIQQKKG